jgi:hypothetical protein
VKLGFNKTTLERKRWMHDEAERGGETSREMSKYHIREKP